jgi:hypothetical protein
MLDVSFCAMALRVAALLQLFGRLLSEADIESRLPEPDYEYVRARNGRIPG